MFELENVTVSWTDRFIIEKDSIFDSNFSNGNVSEFLFDGAGSDGIKLNIPYVVMELLVALIAVVGNAIVIIAFLRERKLRKRTNFYILSLALADFLLGLLGIPFAILVNNLKQNDND